MNFWMRREEPYAFEFLSTLGFGLKNGRMKAYASWPARSSWNLRAAVGTQQTT
jgi:hypothetical protein